MLTETEKNKIWELIKPARVAMLSSWDGTHLNSRPMAQANKKFEGTLYFFTKIQSDKMQELQRYPEVNLAYRDEDESNYISLSGEVALSQDKALIGSLWNPFVAAWFPKGKDSEEVGLLCITVTRGEYWDGEDSMMKKLFEIAKANITQSRPDMGENVKLG